MFQPFEVGDKVAVITRGNRAPQLQKVTRVMKRFVQLDDDSRWTLTGMEYPASRVEWPSQHIVHWTEQHARQCLLAEAVRVARNLVERLNEREPLVMEAWQLVEELRTLLGKVDDENDRD